APPGPPRGCSLARSGRFSAGPAAHPDGAEWRPAARPSKRTWDEPPSGHRPPEGWLPAVRWSAEARPPSRWIAPLRARSEVLRLFIARRIRVREVSHVVR